METGNGRKGGARAPGAPLPPPVPHWSGLPPWRMGRAPRHTDKPPGQKQTDSGRVGGGKCQGECKATAWRPKAAGQGTAVRDVGDATVQGPPDLPGTSLPRGLLSGKGVARRSVDRMSLALFSSRCLFPFALALPTAPARPVSSPPPPPPAPSPRDELGREGRSGGGHCQLLTERVY